jgi:hypothetical protein
MRRVDESTMAVARRPTVSVAVRHRVRIQALNSVLRGVPDTTWWTNSETERHVRALRVAQ